MKQLNLCSVGAAIAALEHRRLALKTAA